MSDFKVLAAQALARTTIPFEDGDLDVLEVVTQVFEPAMNALDGAPLEELPFEASIDPGSAPLMRARS